ncbi:MAG: hypothetical protein CVU01_04115 [Bacteroidetes bacterium HGW-Bacteroidetes-18]|nr:MAG: hypothetical protein CVU01_04115 [Bacteroidetes bacterium HGW-Bacteroidetes-18]
MYVRELGTGKDTVIVVHGGFGANHDYMLDAIKGLETKYHFVLYDQRGSTLSPAPIEKLTFPNNVADLYQLVSELKLTKAKIMCHSMGTLVGMEFLKLHPEKISNLILIGAIPTQADTVGGSNIFSKRYENQVAILMNRKEVKNLKEYYESKNGNDTSQIGYYNYKSLLTDKEQTELWRINFASVNIYRMANWRLIKGGRAYYKQAAAVMAESVNWVYDYRQALNDNGKVTIIMGDHDFIDFNAEYHRKLLANFPRVKVVTIEDAGHNIWTDDPDKFKTELNKALIK